MRIIGKKTRDRHPGEDALVRQPFDDRCRGNRQADGHFVEEGLVETFNARDLDALMDCMAEDCAFHAAAGPGAEGAMHQGRAAVRAAYAAILAAFPQAEWTEGRHSVAGDTGLSSWRFRGTTAEGAAVDVRGCDLFTFDGERIALKDSYRKARG